MLRKMMFSLLVLTLTTSAAFAGGDDTSKQVKNQVLNNLYHDDNRTEGVVNAQFTVDEAGNLDLKSVDSDNVVLKDFVRHRLENMVVKLWEKTDERTFNLNILFKKER